jgi:hypothetical protein
LAKHTTYSGFLNQHEFLQRLHFMRSRILNGYTAVEVAFLLGRAANYIRDYEELGSVKLDSEDLINHSCLFTERLQSQDTFDRKKDDTDISYEKRMLRGARVSSATEISYEFIHPWTRYGVCKPFLLTEPLQPDQADQEVQLRGMLSNLMGNDYLRVIRSPMEIYKETKRLTPFGTVEIISLKHVLYQLVQTGKLVVKTHNDKFYFKILPELQS